MPSSDASYSHRSYHPLARAASLIVIVSGGLVLLGWLLDPSLLERLSPGGAIMKPNTALSFIFLGSALLLILEPARDGGRSKRIVGAHVIAVVAALFGLVTLTEYALHFDAGIDHLFFAQAGADTSMSHPGRMTPAIAFNFLILAAVLLILDSRWPRVRLLAEHLTLLAGFIGLVAIVGYTYDVQELYHFSIYSSISFYTSALFVVLSTGILMARPRRGMMATITSDEIGGVMARRLLPMAILLPFVIDWLRVKGQRIGLYESEFGVAVFATANIVLFSIVVWMNARSLNRIGAERHNAEKALRDSERRHRALLERSSDAMTLADRHGDIFYASPAVATIEGRSNGEVQRHNYAEHTHPDDMRMLQERFQLMMSSPGVPVHMLWRRRHSDGRWLWLEGDFVNLLDDPAVGAVVTNYRDITNRKLAEDALRESEERFSKVFESSPAGMVLIQLEELRYVDTNESWLNLIGYERDEVIGHTADELGVTETQDRIDRVRRVYEMGGVLDEEVKLKTKQGEIRYCHVSAQIVMLKSEPYLIGVYIDVTERKRAEDVRRRLEERLSQSQKMEGLGTLASGIAHDFNNILTAIVGNAKMARADLDAGSPIQANLGEIYKAGVRATDLVRRILTFSRQQTFNRVPMKLRPVVEEAVALLRASLPARIEIRTVFDSQVPSISADPTQMHQVLMNLGTNAAHAIGERDGVLEVDLKAVTVSKEEASAYSELREGRWVRLSVSDNGAGMDEATRQRIFDPFFTTKPAGEGTGLGLSVVHGIVRGHDGAIVVYSQPGVGTIFHLYFPVVEEEVAAEAPAPRELAGGEGARVLYVDDESAIVTIVKLTLERVGFRVTSFSDPTRAVQAFEKQPGNFDAVVTDLSMPGMSGIELARAMLAVRPDIPIVLTSGYMPDSDVETARRVGIRGFLAKPASIDQLQRMLVDLIGKHP